MFTDKYDAVVTATATPAAIVTTISTIAAITLTTTTTTVTAIFTVSIYIQQEPGDNGTEILNTLRYVRPGGGFVPNFQLTEKVDVNGKAEHPMYTYLKVRCGTWLII